MVVVAKTSAISSIQTRFQCLKRGWGKLRSRFYTPMDWVELSKQLNIQSALIVIAHPDDEVFCSGLIAALADDGVRVHIAVLTRGEGARLDGMTPQQVGRLREKELRDAVRVLRVNEIHFLDFQEPVVMSLNSPNVELDYNKSVEKITKLVEALEADLVVTHGSDGEYGHPVHIFLNRVMCHVNEIANRHGKTSFLSFNAFDHSHKLRHLQNPTDMPEICFDGEEYAERRLESLVAHESQCYIFESFGDGTLRSFIEATNIETYAYLKGR